MKMMQKKTIYEFPIINTLFGIVGLIIIWISSHNWWAILGGIIGALHFQTKAKKG